jgi:predicted RNase H-like nuclease (RuvC/YqgF family)
MSGEDKLPHIILHHNQTKKYKAGNIDMADITLHVEIKDDNADAWREVEQMLTALTGYRVYSRDDFKGELINVLQNEVKQLEGDVGSLKYENRRLLADNIRMEAELKKYRDSFSDFRKQFSSPTGQRKIGT